MYLYHHISKQRVTESYIISSIHIAKSMRLLNSQRYLSTWQYDKRQHPPVDLEYA